MLRKAVNTRLILEKEKAETEKEKAETKKEKAETEIVVKLRQDAKARPLMMKKASTEKLNKLRQIKVESINSITDEDLKYDLFDTYSHLDIYFKQYLPENYESVKKE